jgi:hypothetical protein
MSSTPVGTVLVHLYFFLMYRITANENAFQTECSHIVARRVVITSSYLSPYTVERVSVKSMFIITEPIF